MQMLQTNSTQTSELINSFMREARKGWDRGRQAFLLREPLKAHIFPLYFHKSHVIFFITYSFCINATND